MTDAATVKEGLLASLAACEAGAEPYPHWFLTDALPAETCEAIAGLPIAAPAIADTGGKRDTHNDSRTFFSAENRGRFPVCDAVAGAFQDPATVRALEATCGVTLGGGLLRIEYCQDTDGFWLEPHTDIGAKLFTMLVYLSKGPEAEGWGTDIMDGDKNTVGMAPCGFGRGLIFIPGVDTWHGFDKRPIRGVRKSIIVNYVKGEWRSRHELAFPSEAVG